MRARRSSSVQALWVLGGIELILIVSFGYWTSLPMPLPRLLLPLAAFACCLFAHRTAKELRTPCQGTAIAVLSCAIAARALLFPLLPELSDDVYRFIWDGSLALDGVSPYAHVPASAELASLRPTWHEDINHPEIGSIYPPLAQALFAAGVRAGRLFAGAGSGALPLVLGVKAICLLFEAGAAVILYGLAKRAGRNPWPTLILFLWSPLLLVETSWNAHFDMAGAFFLCWLCMLLTGRGRRTGKARLLAGFALACAALVKWAPAALAAILFRRGGAKGVAVFLAALCAGLLAFLYWQPAELALGLSEYARRWEANAGPYAALELLLGDSLHARIAAAVLFLCAAAFVALRAKRCEDAILWTLGAALLLSPVVHPWYILWILPFAALEESRPFLLLSGACFLGYWGWADYQASGIWPEPLWARFIFWAPAGLPLAEKAVRTLQQLKAD